MRNPGGALTPTGKDTANRKGTAMSNNENTTEVWKPIPGWEQYYEVSTHGRVRSVDRSFLTSSGKTYNWRGRIMKLTPDNNGYMRLTLSKNDKQKSVTVHRLVLETFVGTCPAGLEGCHNNGNPSDNRLVNLRWDTKSANAKDRVAHGRDKDSRKTHCIHGHILESPNLVVAPSLGNRRNCLACGRARSYTRKNPHLKPHFQELADSYYAKIMPNHSAG